MASEALESAIADEMARGGGMFEMVLAMQGELQRSAYGRPLESLVGQDQAEAFRTHTLALLDEVHEMLRETPWKPWKKQQTFNRELYLEEMADAFHFWMNLMLVAGITPRELFRSYLAKHDVNLQRQADGY